MLNLTKIKLNVLLISCLLLLSIFFRFFWLDILPIGMTNDELEYILSSKTYALYGKDLSGYSFPYSLLVSRTEGVISAIPPLLTSPLYMIAPLNQFTARLPYVVVSILTGFAVFCLSYLLTRKKIVSSIAALFFLVSPWSMFLSRNTVDSSFALLFYLWGIIGLLKYSGKKLVIPLIFFVLGFFSYHGAKPVLLPLIGLSLFYRSYLDTTNKLKVRWSLIITCLTIAFLAIYLLANHNLPNSILSNKSADLFLVDINTVNTEVNDLRRMTIENPLEELFLNKYIASGRMFINSYLQAFSTGILFIYGDPRATYQFGEHGLLYYFDIILIPLGLIVLSRQNRKALLFLIAILLIAPIPTAINKVEISVINRSFMMLPVFMILSSIGACFLIFEVSKGFTKKLTVVLALTLFSFSILNFYHYYFFTYPIKGQETYLFSEKVLSKYLKFDSDHPTVVITEKPRSAYLRAIFYSDQETQRKLLKETYIYPENRSYTLNNTEYTLNCPTEPLENTQYMVSRKIDRCLDGVKYDLSITDQKDAGDVYKIYNASTCLDVSNERWKRFHNISDYNLNQLDYKNFCNIWISRNTN